MATYILGRLLLLGPVMFGLSVILFVIGRLLPSDPARAAAGPYASEAHVAALTEQFGLDQPLFTQYWRYLEGLVQGDWGTSIFTQRPVLEDLLIFLPATLELVVVSLFVAVLIGIPAGIISGVYANRWPDYLSRLGALGAISMPRFFLALLLQLYFASWLGLLPLAGRFPLIEMPPPSVTGFYTIDSLLAGDLDKFWLACQFLALPAIATCLNPLAATTRIMRASYIEVLQQDYILTERALGLPRHLIVLKYALKNALSATLTTIGLYFGWMLGGTVLVETVFDWPGIGLYATNAILNQDLMPVMGVTMVIGIIFVLTNLAVDLLYGVLNPKVKYA